MAHEVRIANRKCERRFRLILHPRLFYPPWEILPHEGKLPHADTISDRFKPSSHFLNKSAIRQSGNRQSIVTSVTALLQKTFPPGEIQKRTRKLQRGDKINPLDLIEWLEEQGYEPEAQVTQKGEIALRGGILDVWPLTSPWPVRLEFFGDELESLRHFDPLTQISREEISSITIPPGGELGILKKWQVQVTSGRKPLGIRRVKILSRVTRHSPPFWIICRAKPFFCFANRSNSPSAPTNTRSKFPATIHFLSRWDEFQRRTCTQAE